MNRKKGLLLLILLTALSYGGYRLWRSL
ncbi:MAG: hypothetical protein QG604_976, partial [Candidatus Dependentiae bacterium]|nr:hypothetical protein [Candidatus Dependentiae bacterium]